MKLTFEYNLDKEKTRKKKMIKKEQKLKQKKIELTLLLIVKYNMQFFILFK